jgi:hypothetical protein
MECLTKAHCPASPRAIARTPFNTGGQNAVRLYHLEKGLLSFDESFPLRDLKGAEFQKSSIM